MPLRLSMHRLLLPPLDAMAPSWVLGAHGVAMLHSWTAPDTQAWVTQSLGALREWKRNQVSALEKAGWTVKSSDANFFCARPPEGVTSHSC